LRTSAPLKARIGIAGHNHTRSRCFTLASSFVTNEPSMADSTTPRFGFVAFAETWNGRLAMLGFVIGLATEVLTGQGILGQIGLG
jgi:ferrochelatase